MGSRPSPRKATAGDAARTARKCLQPRPPIVIATLSAGEDSVAVCDQVRAVDKRCLTRNEGRLSEGDLGSVEDGLRRVLVL